MRIPRISISEIMALVGLVAVDCWAYSFMLRPGNAYDRLLMILAATLLTANALAIGLYLAFKDRLRKRPSSPFVVGFVVVGSVSMILAALVMVFFPDGIDVFVYSAFLKPSVVPILERAGLLDTSVGRTILITAVLAFFAAPQFLLAGARGLITSRYRFKFVTKRRIDEPADHAPQTGEVIPVQ